MSSVTHRPPSAMSTAMLCTALRIARVCCPSAPRVLSHLTGTWIADAPHARSVTSSPPPPRQIRCPAGQARKSVAIYYVSDPRPGATPRLKAAFRPRPGLPVAAAPADGAGVGGYLELCRLRDSRLLRPEDVRAHTPAWRPRWSPHGAGGLRGGGPGGGTDSDELARAEDRARR